MAAAMEAAGSNRLNARLPPEVNRAVYVRNLPFNISSEEMVRAQTRPTFGAIPDLSFPSARLVCLRASNPPLTSLTPLLLSSPRQFDIFGKYGALRQVRIGNTKETRGTAYVVYEDIYDAKNAVDHLSGFNVANRYLICLYYNPQRMNKRQQNDLAKKQQEIKDLQERYGVDGQSDKL